jgi:chromate transporter
VRVWGELGVGFPLIDAVSLASSPWAIFLIFVRLGLTSFGGPVAHLAFFRDEFVNRRRWLDERAYADLVALCQFLPGPASSQVGMALGLSRAGYWGALAAWAGFTLPSALAMMALAAGLIHGGALLGNWGGVLSGAGVAWIAIGCRGGGGARRLGHGAAPCGGFSACVHCPRGNACCFGAGFALGSVGGDCGVRVRRSCVVPASRG